MQDPNVVIKVTTSGVEEAEKKMAALGASITKLSVNANGTVTASGKLTSTLNQQATTTDKVANATDRAANAQKNWFAHITRTTIQSAIVNKAFLGVVEAMGQAVKQADLISNFPATMGALGISTKTAQEGFSTLQRYVQQTAGDLTLATNAVTRFAAINKDVKASVAVYAGVNNALIAGAASAESQAGAMEQLLQAYSRGSFEGEEWRSINSAMGASLQTVAKEMGYVSTSGLQDALREGKVSMNEFITELTQLSTGSGPIAQQAIARMNGIQFAGNAMKNALVNGLTQIYLAVGRQNIINFFNFLTQVIGVLLTFVVRLINAFMWLFGLLTGQKIDAITGDTADNLQNSADGANDTAKGLDDASKSAKKLRNQLAAFDKMNVLTEPKDDDDSGSGGGGFNADQTKALGDIFGNLTGDIQEASKWAKIFAGILVGIAAYRLMKFVWTFVGPGLELIRRGMQGAAVEGSLLNRALLGIGRSAGIAAASITTLANSAGLSLTKLAKNPFFLIAAVIAAIVAGFVVLYNTNEEFKKGFDSVWKPIIKVLTDVGNVIKNSVLWALNELKKIWDAMSDAVVKGLEKISPGLADIVRGFTDWVSSILGLKINMETLGVVIGILAGIIGSVLLAQLIMVIARVVMLGFTWTTTIVGMASTLAVNAVKMAASWLVAMGPIAILVAAVIALVAIVIANWETIKQWFADFWSWIVDVFTNIWNGIVSVFSAVTQWFRDLFKGAWDGVVNIWNGAGKFFRGVWDGITKVFSSVGNWFKNVFQGAWDGIKNIFNAVGGFFRGVWDTIVGIFGKIGTSIGNAIGNAFKTVVNSIIGFAENTINLFIRAINGAISLINAIPGVDIKTLNELRIPRLATGGVVSKPTLAEIGEDGAEAVVPLENNTEWIEMIASRLNSTQTSNSNPDIIPVTNTTDQPKTEININVSGVFATSEQEKKKVAQEIAKQLDGVLRAKGLKGTI